MKEDFISRLYKTLWSRLGERPWTYIIRDAYHARPLIWLGLAAGLGILLGHLFWGTPWIPGQGTEGGNP